MRTSITNTSGVAKYFGWLPPHGVLLDDGEEKVIEGDLRTILGDGRSQGLAGLDDAVAQGIVVEAKASNPSSSSSSSSPEPSSSSSPEPSSSSSPEPSSSSSPEPSSSSSPEQSSSSSPEPSSSSSPEPSSSSSPEPSSFSSSSSA